jgi:Sec-independent protein translocase protein TatA
MHALGQFSAWHWLIISVVLMILLRPPPWLGR